VISLESNFTFPNRSSDENILYFIVAARFQDVNPNFDCACRPYLYKGIDGLEAISQIICGLSLKLLNPLARGVGGMEPII
jgi:hypothetical protein